jgi:hypothetical protein
VTAGIVGAIGDLGTQLLVEGHSLKNINWSRTQRFGGLGLFVAAPALHLWYGWLARTFPKQVLKRVAADQFGFAPVFLAGFIFANDYLQYHSFESAKTKVQNEWVHTVLVNWVVWIPFQSLNFNFVPLPFQVLANNCAAVFWNGWLSWRLHNEMKHDLKHA